MSTDGISRRGFVGAVGATAGASTLFGAPAIAAGAPASEKIRLVLIGSGSRGNQLLDSFLPRPEAEIVGVVDVDDHQAGKTQDRVAKQYGHPPATARDYRPMLDRKDIDAVVIATPDHWHALAMIAAVQSGADVWCQKPISVDVIEGQAMLAAARAADPEGRPRGVSRQRQRQLPGVRGDRPVPRLDPGLRRHSGAQRQPGAGRRRRCTASARKTRGSRSSTTRRAAR